MDRAAIAAALRQAAEDCEADHKKGAPVGALPPWFKTLANALLPLLLQFLNQGSPPTP